MEVELSLRHWLTAELDPSTDLWTVELCRPAHDGALPRVCASASLEFAVASVLAGTRFDVDRTLDLLASGLVAA